MWERHDASFRVNMKYVATKACCPSAHDDSRKVFGQTWFTTASAGPYAREERAVYIDLDKKIRRVQDRRFVEKEVAGIVIIPSYLIMVSVRITGTML